MPLNLLQHKSWHVGSAKNQERVRRDEREAKLKEEEEERRMQLADAERRLQILRNRLQNGQTGDEVSLQLDHEDVAASASAQAESRTRWGERERTSKKRRRGDDDDDEIPPSRVPEVATVKYTSSDAPLTGPDGHINLFPPQAVPQKGAESSKNKEYMAEKKRKEEELEAQYTMKLERPAEPWYSSADMIAETEKSIAEEKKRKAERVEQRAREDNDPMNAMKKGLSKLRDVREQAALERRKRDAEVGIGLSEDVERSSRERLRKHHPSVDNERQHQQRRSSRSRSGSRSRRRSRDRSRDRRRHDHAHERSERYPKDREDGHRHHQRRSSHRSRSRSREHDSKKHRHRSDSSRNRFTNDRRGSQKDDIMAKLRAEKMAREENERRKAEALVKDEVSFRKPERWTASSNGGRGKYSKQFGE